MCIRFVSYGYYFELWRSMMVKFDDFQIKLISQFVKGNALWKIHKTHLLKQNSFTKRKKKA